MTNIEDLKLTGIIRKDLPRIEECTRGQNHPGSQEKEDKRRKRGRMFFLAVTFYIFISTESSFIYCKQTKLTKRKELQNKGVHKI